MLFHRYFTQFIRFVIMCNILIFVVVKGSSVQNILWDKWRASFRTMSLFVVKLHKSPTLQVSERPLIKAL